MIKKQADLIIVGGGAASFFFASNLENKNGRLKVILLEQTKQLLSKVRISGGGRCNVTNATEEPLELIKAYPRGSRELLGPFNTFHCGHTKRWFESRGLKLKTEADGRVFPVSDNSEDVIQVLMKGAKTNHVEILTEHKVKDLWQDEHLKWHIVTDSHECIVDVLVLGTGSSTFIWNLLGQRDIQIVSSVPSLFTFKSADPVFKGLEGIAQENVSIKIKDTNLPPQSGPLLITHEGLSGPAVLRTSAFGARILQEKNYEFTILINWLPDHDEDIFSNMIRDQGKKQVSNGFYHLPARLWERLLRIAEVNPDKKWAEISKAERSRMIQVVFETSFKVKGKSTFKDEFVTSGGIDLKEINFRSFQVKKYKNLYCIGEMLDIDAVTGGYNFQACWTGAFLAAKSVNEYFTPQ